PGTTRRCILHRHTAAVGCRPVVGDDHVGERQIGVSLVADAASARGGPVWICGVKHNAVLNGKPLHSHDNFRGEIGRVAGVDVEYPVGGSAVDHDSATAGVEDGEIAVGVRNDIEIASNIIVLAGPRDGDL